MRPVLKSSIAAAALAASALPMSLAPAGAMPAVQPIPLADSAPAITLTSGGCGPFRHRGPWGGCRPNFYGGYGYGPRWGWRRPWGWHRWGWRRW